MQYDSGRLEPGEMSSIRAARGLREPAQEILVCSREDDEGVIETARFEAGTAAVVRVV